MDIRLIISLSRYPCKLQPFFRSCDPYTNQFSQPDTLIPDQYNSLDWNRYAYARYNPIRYSDPSGHMAMDDNDGGCFICGDELQPPEPSTSISSGNQDWTPYLISDEEETYFSRDPFWYDNPHKDLDAAEGYMSIKIEGPVTSYDYASAIANGILYLETNTTWWNRFGRWGIGAGPDAVSSVKYFRYATSIERDAEKGMVFSGIDFYASSNTDISIWTTVSNNRGIISDLASGVTPSLTCNAAGTSHQYIYNPPLRVPAGYSYTLGSYLGASTHEFIP